MKKKLKKIAGIIALLCFITTLFQNNSLALNPDVAHVTSESDIEALLGTTSVQARRDWILGLAHNYSVFVEEDFTIHDAETGGRAAVGEKFEATTDYKYQVGSGIYNYTESEHSGVADIVVGNGPIKNVETLYGATIQGENYNMKKKIVVSDDATNMNWSDYTAEELETFVQADAINFSSEFQYLRQVSNDLKNYDSMSGYTYGGISTKGNANPIGQMYHNSKNVCIFKGSNPYINVFSVSNAGWSSINDIVFDVPYGSYVIVNITGDNIVLDGTHDSSTAPHKAYVKEKNILYPVSRAEIAENGIDMMDEAFAYYGKGYCKDEEGYVKSFTKLLNGTDKYWDKGEHILFNLPDATSFTIKGNWIGSILAPNAAGTDDGKDSDCAGHLSGNLICKSYEGYQEFGTALFSLPGLDIPKITIRKTDINTDENIAGAVLQIRDLDGNVLYQWESETESKTVDLSPGTYLLYEISAPENYNVVSQCIPFEVKANGSVAKKTGSIQYKTVESVPVDASEQTEPMYYNNQYGVSKYIRDYEAETGKRINKISFKPDTSAATFRPDWGLDYIVSDTNGDRINGSGAYIWLEPKSWTRTQDGKEETAYICPFGFDTYSDRSEIHFYRGSDQTHDVKIKDLTLYYDEVKTKSGSGANTDNVTVSESVITIGNVPDTIIKVDITKTDKKDGSALAGIGFGLYSSEANSMFAKDELVIGGVTDTNGKLTLERGKIPAGTYYVKEISAPIKYAIPTDKWEFAAVENTYKKYNLNVENEEAVTTVTVNKTYKGSTDPVQYATFIVYAAEDIYNENGTKIYSKGSSINGGSADANGKLTFTFKPETYRNCPGKYYLKEIYGPTWLVFPSDTEYNFEIKQNIDEYVFNIENDYTKVEIEKVDKTNGELLPGATLKVTNINGTTVYDTWTTTDEAHRINKLGTGRYKLVEEEAPDGYTSMEDVEFVVTSTGEIQKVRVDNERTKLNVEKIDQNGDAVVGAKLKILSEDGTEMATWTTDREPHYIEKLPIGKYTLTEIETPDGYNPGSDVSFEIEDTSEIQTVQMKNEKIEEDTPEDTPEEDPDEKKEEQESEESEPEERNAISTKTGDRIMITFSLLIISTIILIFAIIRLKF